MRHSLGITVLALLLSGTGLALADGPLKAMHGGKVVETPDGIRVEFAAREGVLHAWVRDHGDKPVPSSALIGKATLLVGTKKLEVPLRPEGNRLVGQGDLGDGDKLTAILALAVNGKPVVVRFTLP